MHSEYLFHEDVGNIDCLASLLDGYEVSRISHFFNNYHDDIVLFG
jgi:hypothetical protein